MALRPLLAVTTLVTAAFVGSLWLPSLPPHQFAVIFFTLAPAAALVATALLGIRARSEADPGLCWTVAGTGLAALALGLQLQAFPALSPTGGLFDTGAQGMGWLYLAFHLALAAGAAAAAVGVRRELLPPVVLLGAFVVVLVAVPAATPARPVFVTASGAFTTADTALRLALLLVTVASAALWVRRSGPRPSATRAWVLAALLLSSYELVVNIAGHRRYSELWWASLGLRVATYAVLVVGLLWVTARQLGMAERAMGRQLAALDGEVHTWTDATDRLIAAGRLLSEVTSPDALANTLALVCGRIRPGSECATLAVAPDGSAELLGEPSLLAPRARLRVAELAASGAAARLARGPSCFVAGGETAALPELVPLALGGAVAVLPLRSGDSSIGLALVMSPGADRFSTLEQQLLTAISRQAAQALRQAQTELEAQQAAAALARLNASLHTQVETLVDAAPDAIITCRLDGTILDVNTHTTELFGYAASDLVGSRVERLLPERLRAQHTEHRTGYAARPALRPMGRGMVLTAQRADGSEFPVEVSLAPMPTGKETVVLATVRDMSEIRRTEAQLHEAVQRFTAAFDDAPVGMALVALDGRFVQVNRALTALLDHRGEELTGRTVAEITDPRDLGDDAGQYDDLLAGRSRGYQRETRLLNAEGAPVWTQTSTSAIRDPDGVPICLIMHVQDLSERKTYENRLQFLADHDPLTGLYNRRRFDQELQRHLAEHSRYGGAGAVLMLDLDNFKYVNDTLGHSVGDALIRRVSSALRHRLRDSDVLARFGGDEFAVLLPAADTDQARDVAEALAAAVRDNGFVSESHRKLRTTASIGVMPMQGDGPETAEELLATADLAMYAAKEQGRDRVEVYDPDGPHVAKMEARFHWLDRVHEALEHDQFTLLGQPILDLSSNRVSHVEVLLRLQEGERLLPPGLFLYIAERHGLAPAIDRWVVHATLALARASGVASPRLELNLSGDSLADPTLGAFIADELQRSGVDPRRLVFEITETAAITNMDLAREFVDEITSLGCAFALDDFGAGFGSFYYLKYLPFDYLKIDGEFIRQLTSSPADRLIVSSIVSAAHGLGKKTIAEYVGDADTVRLLRELGVDYAQGYHIGHPSPLLPPAVPIPAPRGPQGTTSRQPS